MFYCVCKKIHNSSTTLSRHNISVVQVLEVQEGSISLLPTILNNLIIRNSKRDSSAKNRQVLFQLFWFEMARGKLSCFWGFKQYPNINIWGKILEGPHHEGHSFKFVILLGAPLVVGSLNHFYSKFVFSALFGPNDVLETHIGPFLDQQSL